MQQSYQVSTLSSRSNSNSSQSTNHYSSSSSSSSFHNQLPRLSLSGSSDGTPLYKLENHFNDNWNGNQSSKSSAQYSEVPSEWQRSDNRQMMCNNSFDPRASFHSNEFNNPTSGSWSSNQQQIQVNQQRWESNSNSEHAQLENAAAAKKASEELVSRQVQDQALEEKRRKDSIAAAQAEKVKVEQAITASRRSKSSSTTPSSKKPSSSTHSKESTGTESAPSSASTKKSRKRKTATVEQSEESSAGSGSGSVSSGRYPCLHPECDKTFSTSGHRARHNRIHTGEFTFQV